MRYTIFVLLVIASYLIVGLNLSQKILEFLLSFSPYAQKYLNSDLLSNTENSILSPGVLIKTLIAILLLVKLKNIIWEFKGFGGVKVKNQLLIHEYASLSTGKFPLIRNKLKVLLNHKPNLRIFLNENVKSGFNFHDNVDFCYRDMGIDKSFLYVDKDKKEYEFVYVGLISKSRNINQLLEM